MEDALEGCVPVDRLTDAFNRAVRDHSSSFPVNAYEVRIAWATIEIEEKAQALQQERDRRAEDAIGNCSNRANHVDDDRAKASDGLVELYDPVDDSTQLVPCWGCRPRAYEIRTAEIIEAKKGSGVPEPVTSAVDEVTASMDMNRAKPVVDDGRELLEWAIRQLVTGYSSAEHGEYYDIRIFKYPLFGKIWRVNMDATDIEELGRTLHHAHDYIKLGPDGYAALKAKEVGE